MKKIALLLIKPLILLILITTFLPPNSSFATSPFTGIWQGALNVQGTELGLSFTILQQEDTSLRCTMDVPMQGAKDLPASEITASAQQLNIKFAMMNASYTGSLAEDKNTMTGVWSQNGMSFDLTMKRIKEKSLSIRPQEPQAPYPYDIRDVHFSNEEAENIELAGTLTLPKGEGPFPAVVLISGSGPQNRDEELMGHKPFLIIADHFTRNGIAVLRYDDRGVAHSGGDFSSATSADFASDAAAAASFLKQQDKINPEQVGLCGHSEGGMIAPMVAAGSGDFAFIIMMAGPGQNIVDLLLLQSELISKAMGESDEDIEKGNRINRKIYEIVIGDGTTEERKTKLREMMEKEYQGMSQKDKENFGDFETAYERIEGQMFNPWMEYFLRYEPAAVLQQVSCPVLAINGETDLQVSPKENLSAIKAALETAPCTDFTVLELKGLNHLFQHSTSGSPVEYGTIEETFAPEALAIMTKWLLEKVNED